MAKPLTEKNFKHASKCIETLRQLNSLSGNKATITEITQTCQDFDKFYNKK